MVCQPSMSWWDGDEGCWGPRSGSLCCLCSNKPTPWPRPPWDVDQDDAKVLPPRLLKALTSTLAEDKRGGAGGSAPKATRGQGGQGAGAGEPGWCAASTLGGRQGCGAGRDCGQPLPGSHCGGCSHHCWTCPQPHLPKESEGSWRSVPEVGHRISAHGGWQLEKRPQLEKTVKNRQNRPVLSSKGTLFMFLREGCRNNHKKYGLLPNLPRTPSPQVWSFLQKKCWCIFWLFFSHLRLFLTLFRHQNIGLVKDHTYFVFFWNLPYW